MTEHGRFRSIYEAFFVDPDQQALSDRAVRAFIALKTALPAAGIGIVLDQTMMKRCGGCTVDQLHDAYRELEAQKPSGESGWIRREDSIIWVVNGLQYERSIAPTNSKHARGISDALAPFEDFAIASDFKERYPQWFGGSTPAPRTRKPLHRPTVTPPESHSVSHSESHGVRLSETRDETVTETRLDSSAARSVVGDIRPDYVTRCVIALNAGMQANTRVRCTEVATSTQRHRVTWEEDGIPVEIAEAVIAEKCRAFEPTADDQAIHSLKFFDATVRKRWRERQTTGPLERARVLFQLGKDYGLFRYFGNSRQYNEDVDRACADPRAGANIRNELKAARLAEGIGDMPNDHFAALEIAKRLDAAGVKVA